MPHQQCQISQRWCIVSWRWHTTAAVDQQSWIANVSTFNEINEITPSCAGNIFMEILLKLDPLHSLHYHCVNQSIITWKHDQGTSYTITRTAILQAQLCLYEIQEDHDFQQSIGTFRLRKKKLGFNLTRLTLFQPNPRFFFVFDL